MLKIKILISQVMILLMFFAVPISVCGAEKKENVFKAENELKISIDDMDCNYHSEDRSKTFYNFEYPKMITNDGSNPLIAFIDEKSDRLIFVEIANRDVKIEYSLSSSKEHSYQKWPIISSKGNQIYFSYFSDVDAKSGEKIKIFLFDSNNNKLYLQKVEPLQIPCYPWGVYPSKDNFMVIGTCSDFCWHRLPLLRFHGEAIYFHNASFNLGGNKKLSRQSIEDKGCYHVWSPVYDSSTSGTIHAAWCSVNKIDSGATHDETVYYSQIRTGISGNVSRDIFGEKY